MTYPSATRFPEAGAFAWALVTTLYSLTPMFSGESFLERVFWREFSGERINSAEPAAKLWRPAERFQEQVNDGDSANCAALGTGWLKETLSGRVSGTDAISFEHCSPLGGIACGGSVKKWVGLAREIQRARPALADLRRAVAPQSIAEEKPTCAIARTLLANSRLFRNRRTLANPPLIDCVRIETPIASYLEARQ
jgi:hypothetical protein